MKNYLLLFLFFLSFYSLSAQVRLQDAFPNLTFAQPIEVVSAGDSTNRLFIISQNGIIRVVPNNAAATASDTFLDITSKVVNIGEQGLLGMAFHPDYKNNGYFYLNYTRPLAGAPSESVISRFSVRTTNPNQADPASEVILLTYRQPFANHNGGKLAFGPDGHLYIATGDGGGAGDPQNNAQNLTNLLGKILRIDVNNTSPALNYSIPADNPFSNNTQGFRQEIYAYGLRNPWKFSFDFNTGRLWAGDVGQNSREEISMIEKGGNYGWRMMEGMVCYPPPVTCDTTGLILPVFEYTHVSGAGKSITGGFVYRGSIPTLQGKYIYGDFVSGNIWALTYNPDSTLSNELIISGAGLISAFGEDSAKELYVCNYSAGKIFKIIDPVIAAPTTLIASIDSAAIINLSWQDNAYNETNYIVERAPSAEGPYAVLDTLDRNVVTFSDTNATGGTTYFYRVKAVNNSTNISSAYTNVIIITTPRLDQTITFDVLPDRIADQAPFRLEVTASSGLPVSFAVVSGPASIWDTNLVTIADTGRVVIQASQEGNNNYNPAAPVERSFKVGRTEDLSFITAPADSTTGISTAPVLTGKAIAGASGYIIQLSKNTQFTDTTTYSVDTNFVQASGLDTSLIYYVRVKTDILPNLWGPVTSFKTAGAESLSFITSPADGDMGVSLSPEIISKEIPGATQYIVELNTAADFSGTALVDTSANNTTSFSGLIAHTTYYSRVKTDLLPGLWGRTVSFTTTDQITAVEDEDASKFWIKTYPNPAEAFLNIAFNLPAPARVSVQIFSLIGTTAGILLHEQYFPQGKQQLNWDIHSLAAGVYVYQLKINSEVKTGRIYIKSK